MEIGEENQVSVYKRRRQRNIIASHKSGKSDYISLIFPNLFNTMGNYICCFILAPAKAILDMFLS